MNSTTSVRKCSTLVLWTAALSLGALGSIGCGAAPDDEEATADGTSSELSSGCVTCYVGTNGNDANAGTATAPWRHVGYALARLDAGDTLIIGGGTYVENITSVKLRPGTSTAPINVVAKSGERPVLQGLLWVHSPTYWTFSGLNVTWNPANTKDQHMVKLTNGTNWAFRDAEVWGARSYAGIAVASTLVNEPANWSINNNCVHDTYASNQVNQDHLIYANSGATGFGGLIERNVMFNALNGEGVKVGGPSSSVAGPANVTIRNNTIYNTAQTVLVGWSAKNQKITGNLFDKVSGNYGNIRGYQLTGTGNVASGNLGFGASSLIKNDSGYTGVADGGGNVFPRDPKFDAVGSCGGFHPQDTVAQSFGRYAP